MKRKKRRRKFSTYIQSSLYSICITRKPLVVENDSSRMKAISHSILFRFTHKLGCVDNSNTTHKTSTKTSSAK